MTDPDIPLDQLAKVEKEEQKKEASQEERLLKLFQEIQAGIQDIKTRDRQARLDLQETESLTHTLFRLWNEIEAISQRVHLITEKQASKKEGKVIGVSLVIGMLLGALVNCWGIQFFSPA